MYDVSTVSVRFQYRISLLLVQCDKLVFIPGCGGAGAASGWQDQHPSQAHDHLEGEQGEQGEQGGQGEQGEQDEQGEQGKQR